MASVANLKTSLNAMREAVIEGDKIYHQYIPEIVDDGDITKYGAAVNTYSSTQNAFMDVLMNRIVYTSILKKNFSNPLAELEGEKIPLGYAGQEIYVNPANARQFNDDDFLGLLKKYEADVKVQYLNVNKDVQYPVSIGRSRLEQAFVSWTAYDEFVSSIVDSLWKGLYIDKFRYTKGLISSAYRQNQVKVETIDAIDTADAAKKFVTKARAEFFGFTMPSTDFNAWKQVGGAGRPITTWTEPTEIYFIVRADIRAFLDVEVLANAFNLDKASFMGKIKTVDNFDVINRETGEKVFDGSNIYAIMADRSWFKIKDQNIQLDQFYNASNRVWNYFLQARMMYKYSFFANAVVFAKTAPEVATTGLDYNNTTIVEIAKGSSEGLDINVTPIESTEPVTYRVSGTGVTAVADANNSRHVTINVDNSANVGDYTLTATSGKITTKLTIKVVEA